MKKSVRIVALALVAVMLCFALVSCGKKLNGTYSAVIAGSGAEYEFKGSKVTITVKALGTVVAEVEGKYSIDDDKITFEFESEDSKESDKVKTYNGTFDFEETDDGDIKIGIITYKKQDK
ncbi:MAG: hypothetical protein IKL59_06815 [Clostridia bacterium]|nr:hypothetical protein [Clostridia bacterium]